MNTKITKEVNPRGFPCSIVPDEELWMITGSMGNGGGVIEWCVDEEDANHRLDKLKSDTTGRYKDLKAEKYTPPKYHSRAETNQRSQN